MADSPIECGPTGVIPRSHRSGQAPPADRLEDEDLTCDGIGAVAITASAGDVALFVSDAWHRRLPTRPGDPGRYFLQCHYGRRDLAQRLRTTADSNQLSDEAIARATTRASAPSSASTAPASTTPDPVSVPSPAPDPSRGRHR